MKKLGEYLKLFFPIHHLFANRQGRALIALAAAILAAGTVFYHWAEGWTWIDSLYFCVISLTTVGYGDLAPTRNVSKIFTIFYLIGGISILLGFVDAMAKHRSHDQDPSAKK